MSSSIFPDPSLTRIVTIVAQVDHGKTSLADNLIEANGIISERLAGTLRFLDSLQEEQRRGITMRTSAIGLQHTYTEKKKRKKNMEDSSEGQQHVIHLLDSPGHTDFSQEVTSALQMSDGALLVVDAVEGLCARTHQVLREAFRNQLVPLLVVNKIDRLCCDLCLSTEEAYLRLRGLLETINAASAAMLASSEAEILTDNPEHQNENQGNDEELWTFDPVKGNVVFGSALFGWGFTVPSLSKTLFRTNHLSIKPVVLKQYLFGDFKYRDGKVLKWKGEGDDVDPMFAHFALQPIWDVYQGVSQAAVACGLGSDLFSDGRFGVMQSNNDKKESARITANTPGMESVVAAIGLGRDDVNSVLAQTGSSTEDSVLRCLLRRFRPLHEAVLDAVCIKVPSPLEASQRVRTRALALQQSEGDGFATVNNGVSNCNINGIAVAHVCKFVSAERASIRNPPGDDDNLIFGVARVLSGTLTTGSEYHCMGPKHSPHELAPRRSVQLYLLMGSSFLPVSKVPAGHLCAIYGLEDLKLKTVTLCDSPDGMPLKGFDRGIRPLVKVNVEPQNADDTAALEQGLIKLTLADAAVEVTATAKGERILACLGEIHLEQSILDLQTIYCGKEIKLRISEPIVEFGETTDWFENESDFLSFFDDKGPPLRQTTIPPYNEEEGLINTRKGRCRAVLSGRGAAIGVRVVPLAGSVHKSLQEKKLLDNVDDDILELGKALGMSETEAPEIFTALLRSLQSIDSNGNAMIETTNFSDGYCVQGVLTEEVYAPSTAKEEVDPDADNMHEETTGDLQAGLEEFNTLLDRVRNLSFSDKGEEPNDMDETAMGLWKSQMSGSVVAGFQLGLRAGPVCEESVYGILVVLESVEIALQRDEGNSYKSSKPLSGGMVIGALRQGIRCALLSRPVRLMEGHLKLTLHSSLNGLGSLYGVLSKRRGRVLEDSMVDGTDLLLITATLPQAESFGLSPELLRKTSGEVTVPELTFLKWERLDEDPFWIPTSLEEREDFGELVNSGDSSTGLDNNAIKYIRLVRERKGLLVDSNRTVVAAEKQRTMKR